MRVRALALALLAASGWAGAAPAADPLPRLALDAAQVSVSGISSGAFMASQLHVAHSAGIMGAGLVAGGLYGCAIDSAQGPVVTSMVSTGTGACMTVPAQLLPAADYVARMRYFAARGWIDPLEGLGRSHLYAFTGRADAVTNPATVERAVAVYGLLGLPTAATRFSDLRIGAGHAWVTQRFGSACGANASPYINHCNYDQAWQVLSTLYGPLQPKAPQAAGRLVAFDQAAFAPGGATAANGLWESGLLYVPVACQGAVVQGAAVQGTAVQGAAVPACRLHVVLHGCLQSVEVLGDTFARNIGMNEWAESNRIVVLYPQARSVRTEDFPTPRPSDFGNINLDGCWNWWGYAYDQRYPFKDGVQVSAIWAMIQRLTGR